MYTDPDGFGVNTGIQAVQHWLKAGKKIDGLVAESDHQAFGAIGELLKQGLRVPEDVKVFGVDDSPICDLGPVALSSVSQQAEEIGAQAVQTLMKRIKKEPVESLSIKPVLCLRASTGD